MKERMLSKGLVVGIILLFLFVAFQPAIAVNPISSDNEEDCSICPKVSKPYLVRLKSLINRAETLNNKLSVLSKLNPIVSQKYQELSHRILTLKEINKQYLSNNIWSFPITCVILHIVFTLSYSVYTSIWEILGNYGEGSMVILLLSPFTAISWITSLVSLILLVSFDCKVIYS